ncbi:MAG: methyltransferase domain-containing protein [Nannocystaceae bacterium]
MLRSRLINFLAFEVGARAYDSMTRQEIWREQIARVLEHAPPRPRRVLDLGCGPGISAFVLAQRLGPECEVVGIDRSATMIERARRHHAREHAGLRSLRLMVADATALPFEDASFELVVGHSFLYLVPDREAVLAQVRRVLAPGGSLVLMEPRRGGSLVRAGMAAVRAYREHPRSPSDAARFGASMLAWRVFSGAAGRLQPGQAQRLLSAAGLVEVSTHATLGGLGMHCVGRAPQ